MIPLPRTLAVLAVLAFTLPGHTIGAVAPTPAQLHFPKDEATLHASFASLQRGLEEANALYLKAPWADEFSSSATEPRPFHVRGGATEKVPTMLQKAHFGYARRDGYTAVSLPYSGGDLHFLILMPARWMAWRNWKPG